MRNDKLMGVLLATAVTAFLGSQAVAKEHAKAPEAFCQNESCKGKSACKGHGNDACDGQNGCKGTGFLKAKGEKECKKAGGKWTTEEAKEVKKS
jgi:hypothetical protein